MESTVTTPKPNQQKVPVNTGPKVWKLNSSHRCDRCGESSQAYIKVVMAESQLPLYFCGHHYNKFELALLPITDHDQLINEYDRLDVGSRLIGSEN